MSLPNSAEAERAILGAVLLDNGLISQAIEQLRPEDFYVPSHRRIFVAMIALFERGAEINPILIGEELKKENALEAVGGISFITNLTYGLPHSTNIASLRESRPRQVDVATTRQDIQQDHTGSTSRRRRARDHSRPRRAGDFPAGRRKDSTGLRPRQTDRGTTAGEGPGDGRSSGGLDGTHNRLCRSRQDDFGTAELRI